MPPRRTVARPTRDAGAPFPPASQAFPTASSSSQPNNVPQFPQQVNFHPQAAYMQPMSVQQPPFYPYGYPQQQTWNAYAAYPHYTWPQPNALPPQPAPASASVPTRLSQAPTQSQTPEAKPPRWKPAPAECKPCRKRFSSVVQLIAHQHRHIKCSEGECTFEGDSHALSLHKQDRHLIFPPGHEPKRRKQQQNRQEDEELDEEAALAKQFANAPRIEGTNIKLDSPEAIQAWINERKKRWPTNKRVEEKTALEASKPASAQNNRKRGRKDKEGHRAQYNQPLSLPVNSVAVSQHPSKRKRTDQHHQAPVALPLPPKPSLPTESPASELPERSRDADSEQAASVTPIAVYEAPDHEDDGPVEECSTKRNEEVPPAEDTDSDSASSTSTDASDDSASSASDDDSSPSVQPHGAGKSASKGKQTQHGKAGHSSELRTEQSTKGDPHTQQSRQQTRKPQFISVNQNNLLGRLLERDITHELSDLVQVAEFLVRNNFLDNVELNPGDADEQMIQEIS